MVKGKWKIYGLVCPISKKIRYVGKSSNVKVRYKQHIKDYGESSYKKKWILKLKTKHLIPDLIILDSADTEQDARLKENKQVLNNIQTVYNIFMPNKNAPTVFDYRKKNNITFDCEFSIQRFDTDKYNKA